jgi:hypothetical protein
MCTTTQAREWKQVGAQIRRVAGSRAIREGTVKTKGSLPLLWGWGQPHKGAKH